MSGMVRLARGGVYAQTSAGPIQFGIPPETIKDSMSLGLQVPQIYVVPHEPFDRRRALNVSEFEFPAYYNFFVLKRKIVLVVESAEIERRVRDVLQQSLFGPAVAPPSEEFASGFSSDARPDFAKESEFFRRGPDGSRLDVDTLVDFLHFDARGVARIGDVELEIRPDKRYTVRDGGVEVATPPGQVSLPDRETTSEVMTARTFEPPAFGITVLGASHGFDPRGRTTGFVLWLNHRGLLVDPPSGATDSLRKDHVPAKLVDGVILTHCHADHDAGTFQKILDEGRIKVFTTPTVLGSFLRKYGAISGLSPDMLRRTFTFVPVRIGETMRIHGADLRFHYAFHSIPTLGFEAFFGGKTIAFSSDTHYDPDRIKEAHAKGILNTGRAQQLLSFPFFSDVVLHEAGVPPLHTPISALAKLPPEAKKRMYLVHIAEKDIPADSGLRGAPVGLADTITLEVEPPRHAEAIDLLEAVCSTDLFKDFPLSRSPEVLQIAKKVDYAPGVTVFRQGDAGDRFFLVATGVVAVVKDGKLLREYKAGDYFGETAIVTGRPRSADAVTRTASVLVEIGRADFLNFFRGSDIPERLMRLAQAREEDSWQVMRANSVLRVLTSAQKTQLQTTMELVVTRAGDVLWKRGEKEAAAFLVDSGSVTLEGGVAGTAPFTRGALLCEVDSVRKDAPAETTLRVAEAGRVFRIPADRLKEFWANNPGVLVGFLGTRFVE
ncbi:MAG TPA: cAMP/cGMP-dependent 3',5'-cyclic-AMP/GMP phosphodiesterase [bacterium]|nr:cAMP/cGMP-dependent 3',5'-cyclic-AMP/GMP phosphodiesterase [bacterium]